MIAWSQAFSISRISSKSERSAIRGLHSVCRRWIGVFLRLWGWGFRMEGFGRQTLAGEGRERRLLMVCMNFGSAMSSMFAFRFGLVMISAPCSPSQAQGCRGFLHVEGWECRRQRGTLRGWLPYYRRRKHEKTRPRFELLQILCDCYPNKLIAENLPGHIQHDPDTITANMAYLDEHGLIEASWFKSMSSPIQWTSAKLTCRGVDFLRDDGGLSAILGVVTVKFHEDTIKILLENFITASDLSPPDKRRWISQLQSLPAETTKHLVLRLVDAGLENWSRALPLLQSILG